MNYGKESEGLYHLYTTHELILIVFLLRKMQTNILARIVSHFVYLIIQRGKNTIMPGGQV
jgi:hypothetical protein